ncbi:protein DETOXIFICATION 16-like isoform X1 [Arachis stenosperma]|uniref:protein DETOXIFICATION 16-like isoform X1 n=1 Tax=Arachis stenosperma TaxID=217475 RepID=UPI0025ABF77D|nr:protein DETOXIFICATION 16-like isoform X1 [Arachis stenosperma]
MDREGGKGSLEPLLEKITVESRLKVDDIELKKHKAIERREIFEEARKQLWLAGPLVTVSLLNYGLQVISVMFVGHLGQLPLSGASMATSFASVTGFSLLTGMASALDTLCGQSYGAKQHRMVGIHMQRAILILMILCIPLSIIWANTASILTALGQDPQISSEAGQYAKFMIPSLFAYGLLQCLNRFLQTQSLVFPMLFSSGVTTLLHILICWIMVFKSGLGNKGAAIANAISYWLNVFILMLYVKFSPSCLKTWTGFSREAFHNIPSFMRLAIPSAVMVCLESWSFEMMVLLSGLLPNPKLETSVLSICLNTSTTVWTIPFGLSGAVSTRVSNELGAGHPRAARLAVYFVFAMAMVEGIFVGAMMILIRNIWGYAYSNEEEVVTYVATMLPILATSIFLDSLQCVLSGTARGCGWQKMGALINLGSYYLIGIPAAILFAFVFHMGGKGLWLGIICALIVQVSCLLIITIPTDWEEEAKKANDSVCVYDSILS